MHEHWLNFLPAPLYRLALFLGDIGGMALFAMMMLTVVDIVGRIICDLPSGFAKLSDLRDAPTLVFGSVQSGHAPNATTTACRMSSVSGPSCSQ